MKHFSHAVVGGTFDRFHVGHQKLLDTTFAQSDQVSIGLSQPNLYTHKLLANTIQSYDVREKALVTYLAEKKYTSRSSIVTLYDSYGTTLQDDTVQAIFVTEENIPVVEKINDKRQDLGLMPLEMIVVAYVTGDDGEIVTSERIRSGEIDRTGHAFAKTFEKRTLMMPESLRETLHKPLGEIVKTTDELLNRLGKNVFLITVGDIISASLIEKKRVPDVCIIDLKTRRQVLEATEGLKLFNPRGLTGSNRRMNEAGTINREAVEGYREVLQRCFKDKTKQTLVIDGEEDLLALPAILLAPLGSIVLYGQYDRGIVINRVTEEKKKQIEEILKKFTK